MSKHLDPLDVAATAFGSRLRLDILRTLAHSPDSSAHELVSELDVLRSTLSANLRALESVGLIVSNDPSEDRRGRRLRYRVQPEAYLDALEAVRRLLQR